MKKFLFLAAFLFIASLVALQGQFTSDTSHTEQSIEVSVDEREPVSVAFFGESFSSENPSGFNPSTMTRLLESIRGNKPNALFLTGNLTYGHGIIKNPTDVERNNQKTKPSYSSQAYKIHLGEFLKLVREILGGVPVFPAIGLQEALGADSVQILREEFHLSAIAPLSPTLLAYTVAIQDAFFAVIPTDYYNPNTKKVVANRIPPSVLRWLEQVLKKASESFTYLFVVGHSPAFSTTGAFGKYKGLDKNLEERDDFWSILKDNHVIAYFCSEEKLFDRSNRDGVWQVISGGGGSTQGLTDPERTFFHYLLLVLPKDESSMPILKVFDLNGILRDQVELNPSRYPIIQMRIT